MGQGLLGESGVGFREENAALQFEPLLQALQLMQFVESPPLEGFNSPDVAPGDIVVALAVLGDHLTLKQFPDSVVGEGGRSQTGLFKVGKGVEIPWL